MSAGQREDHYIQDDAELYLTLRLQQLSEQNGISTRSDYEGLYADLINSLKNHKIDLKKFLNSGYAQAIDKTVDEVFATMKNHYQGKTLDFICVETEYRNQNKKGDFVILLDGEEEVSVSLKNYKKLSDIQTCSGTYFSFLNNFLLEKVGVGQYIHPITKKKISSSSDKIWSALEAVGNSTIVRHQRYMKEIQDTLKKKYTKSSEYEFYNEATKKEWIKDCSQFGHSAIDSTIMALSTLPNEIVRDRFLHMSGLDHKEELLIISNHGDHGEFMFSPTHEKYQNLVTECQKPNVTVSYRKNKKNLLITLIGESGNELISIDVPFTFNKNGSWHCPKDRYQGTQYHEKENKSLLWGQLRPKKSGEMATSINTWVRMKEIWRYDTV